MQILLDPHEANLEWCLLDGVLHWRCPGSAIYTWWNLEPDDELEPTFQREVLWALLRAGL